MRNLKHTIVLIPTHIILKDGIIDNKELHTIYHYNPNWNDTESHIHPIFSGVP